MRAVTRPLAAYIDGAIDLNDVAGSDGYLFVRNAVGLAGRGVAARVPIDEAVDVLASIEHDDAMGAPNAGPVALGSLPFVPGAPSELVIPRIVVRKLADGTTAVTTITGGADHDQSDDDVRATLRLRPEEAPNAASWTIDPGVDVERYLRAVTEARDAVRAGVLTKAVIARPIVVRSSAPIDVGAVLKRLRASFGSSYRFSIDGFIGASPELLVEVDGPIVRSHPLAGTALAHR